MSGSGSESIGHGVGSDRGTTRDRGTSAAAGPRLTVGVVGCGVLGRRVARQLHADGASLAVFDTSQAVADRLAAQVDGTVVGAATDLDGCDVVVLAQPATHLNVATRLVSAGVNVVSAADDLDDARGLLGLHRLAVSTGAWMVVGTAMSPGLSGLLAAHVARQLPRVDEIHVATHGTGGPACARQHHDSLGATALAWHDGEWVQRPGGSGRELNWFPAPIGAHDCYRHATADPIVLHEAYPLVARVSARTSATRRDRMTARLPMLSPPHRDGDDGGVRVEVRGADADGARVTLVIGAVGAVADLAAAVAAATVMRLMATPPEPGCHVLGSEAVANGDILVDACRRGVTLHEFTGVAS